MGFGSMKIVRGLGKALLFLSLAQQAAAYTYPDGTVSLFTPGFFGLRHIDPYEESLATGVQAEGEKIFGVSGFVAPSPNQGDNLFREAFYFDPIVSRVIGLETAGTGNGESQANAISANGQIKVGESGDEDGGGPTYWDASNKAHVLYDGSGSSAYAVTLDGSKVAGNTYSGDAAQAAIWSLPGGSLTTLAGLPAYDSSLALAISANGQIIAGRAFNSPKAINAGAVDQARAVRWVLGAEPEDLGMVEGFSNAIVYGMSSDGSTVVGEVTGVNGKSGAFVWTRETGMRGMGTETLAYAVSANGKYIVGEAFNKAFRFRPGLGDLIEDELKLRGVSIGLWTLNYCTGVSQDGQTVCGVGKNPEGKVEGWVAALPDFLHPPILRSTGIQTAPAGELFALKVTATNNPTQFSAKGLPKGFSIDGATGQIAGLWSFDQGVPGIYTVVVTATNAEGTGKSSFQLILPPRGGFQKAIQGLGYLPDAKAPNEPVSNLSFGNGLSANGGVAVGQDGVSNDGRAYRWTQADGISALPRLDGALRSFSTALAVSGDGTTIVGQAAAAPAADGSGRTVAVVWRPTVATARELRSSRDFAESATAPSFTPINLGLFPGGIISLAEAVSANGSVVAGYSDAKDPDPNYRDQVYQAFRWTATDGLVGLGFLPGGLKLSQAFGISADGSTIVGGSDSAQGYQAFRWTQAEGLVGLGKVPGALVSTAYAISADKSAIIGLCTFTAQQDNNHAFRWTTATGMVDLGVVSGDQFSEAKAISADGSIVVGRSGVGFTGRAFIWDQMNGMRDLKSLIVATNPELADWTLRSATGISADGTLITGIGTNPNGDTEAFIAYLQIKPPQLLNIATRMRVSTGENVLIGGFIITGNQAKKVIIRGIGPSLGNFGVQGALADPTLELHQGNTTLLTNDNWREHEAEVQATTIPPSNDLESAIVATLQPGNYTAILADKNGASGIGVVEVYDLDQAANSRLANISSRGFVDTGQNVMIGGVIVGGGTGIASGTVLVRGIGPSLKNAGITGALLDPTLGLFNGSGTAIATNDDWKTTQKTQIEATTIAPSDDRESAILATLPAGNYTAVLSGKNGATGVAVVEGYNLQ
jgi:probable HAF family extracellular repeat protein